jgi:molecular chaperone HscB
MQALKRNYFEFFSLAPAFELDAASLDDAFRAVQASVHPDRFASAGPAEKRYAMQLATMANEANQTLRDPLSRARYLCELNDVAIGAEDNTSMPADFMMQQMEWRESLEDALAQSSNDALTQLQSELDQEQASLHASLASALDEQKDYEAGAALVRRGMFMDRFNIELKQAIRTVGKAA